MIACATLGKAAVAWMQAKWQDLQTAGDAVAATT